MLFDIVMRTSLTLEPLAYLLNEYYILFRLINPDQTYDYRYAIASGVPFYADSKGPNQLAGIEYVGSGDSARLRFYQWYRTTNPVSMENQRVAYAENSAIISLYTFPPTETPLTGSGTSYKFNGFVPMWDAPTGRYDIGYRAASGVANAPGTDVIIEAGTEVVTGYGLRPTGTGNVLVDSPDRIMVQPNGNESNGTPIYVVSEYTGSLPNGRYAAGTNGFTVTTFIGTRKPGATYDQPVSKAGSYSIGYPYSMSLSEGVPNFLITDAANALDPVIPPLFVPTQFEPSFSLWSGSVIISMRQPLASRNGGPREAARVGEASPGSGNPARLATNYRTHRLVDIGRQPTQGEITNSTKIFTAG